jgi:hypothetical protein
VSTGLMVAPLSVEAMLVSRPRLSDEGSECASVFFLNGSCSDRSESVESFERSFSWCLCRLNRLRRPFFSGLALEALRSEKSRSVIARLGLEVRALCNVVEELDGVYAKVLLLPKGKLVTDDSLLVVGRAGLDVGGIGWLR